MASEALGIRTFLLESPSNGPECVASAAAAATVPRVHGEFVFNDASTREIYLLAARVP
jgi:hypothetical protein